MSLTEHLQRNPTYQKGKGRPLPAQGAPLTDLTTVNLSRKRCPKTSGRTCVESMLCKVHPELYIPPLTQPTNNAPDLYHFKRLGVLCWFEVEQSRMVVCWADLVVWCGGGCLIWLADFGALVWRWSGSETPLIVWCGGLVLWSNLEVCLRKMVWSDG